MTNKIEPINAVYKPADKLTEPQITHAEGCWSWGPRHYLCAVREIEILKNLIKQKE